MPRSIRVGIDATPLLGPRTGIGRYVSSVVGALADAPASDDLELRATAFTVRGRGQLSASLPTSVRATG